VDNPQESSSGHEVAGLRTQAREHPVSSKPHWNTHFVGALKDRRGCMGKAMTDTEDKSTCTVRVTIKLRPGEYDELSRHVREIGSTMSAFLRESAVKAMKEGP
jgi:hypothetical protein